jgi:putative peptidoglycan lipid II flippase
MAVGTGLSRLTGFMRLLVAAWALGLTHLTDAYNLANTTPNIVYDLVLGGILSSVFVPVFVEWMAKRGRETAWHSVRSVLTIVTVGLSAIALLAMVFAKPIVHFYTAFGSRGQADTRELASLFLIYFMPQVVFYGLGAVWTGLLNAERRFAAPMFAPILNNLVVITALAIFHSMNPNPTADNVTTSQQLVLVLGTTLGVIAMSVVLWPYVRRTGFRWHWVWDLKDEAFRRIGKLAGWMIVYVFTNQVAYLVIIFLTFSSDYTGYYSAYTYSLIFFQLPFGIFAVSVFTALLPAMSAAWTAQDQVRFGVLTTQGIRMTAFIMLPATFGYIAIAQPLAELFLAHGNFHGASAHLVASVSAWFMLGLFPFAAFQLLIRAFYGMQNSRTPALINIYATILQTLVNIALFSRLADNGLAIGQTVSYAFAAIWIWISLRRRAPGMRTEGTLAALLRSLVAGLAAGAAAWGVIWVMSRGAEESGLAPQVASIFFACIAGLAAFLVVAWALRMEELHNFRLLFRRGRQAESAPDL